MSPRSTLISCGQLVERVAAEPAAGLGDPRVVLHLEQALLVAGLLVQVGQPRLGVDHHAAELQAA